MNCKPLHCEHAAAFSPPDLGSLGTAGLFVAIAMRFIVLRSSACARAGRTKARSIVLHARFERSDHSVKHAGTPLTA